ncbi:MAG: ATP synthase F1 subunit epsilon [Verrucomicrobiae bacterium]|nr:ATP synthase F1 subunit epsilon [Verrucomicrobiae bacterium]
MPLRLEIVTPEAKTFDSDVDLVVLPGVEGEFGVLPGHEHLITQILPGELVVRQNNQEIYLAVGEGFVEVDADRVSVLTDMAVNANDIDEKEAEEARKRAEKALEEKGGVEDEAYQAMLRNSLAKIKVKQHRHR